MSSCIHCSVKANLNNEGIPICSTTNQVGFHCYSCNTGGHLPIGHSNVYSQGFTHVWPCPNCSTEEVYMGGDNYVGVYTG